MLNYNSPIKEDKQYNDLYIKEITSIAKLNIRGKTREFFTSVEKNLNIILPTEVNTSSSNKDITVMWLSPDEWMIVSNKFINKVTNQYEFEKDLFDKISKTNLGAVTDVTDQFVTINLEGKNVYELFSSGSPFNFNEFKNKKGAVAQTLLNHIDVIFHLINENSINLFVRRSFSEHLWSWINDSASRL